MQIKIANGVQIEQHLSEVVDLSNYDFSANFSLKGIDPFTLEVVFNTYEEVVEVELYAELNVTLECAYTLEHFAHPLTLNEVITFNFKNPNIENESDDAYYEKGPLIELDPYVYALILSYIPLKAIKPGATLPTSGEGYEVFDEDEYNAKKQTVGDEFDDIFAKLNIEDD